MNYARALKIARAISGVQQKELAKTAGLDPSYLSLIEMGKRKPSLAAIEKLTSALGIPNHLFTLLASEPKDLKTADTTELNRASESLARLLISHGQTKPRTKSKRRSTGRA
jgi:transcriptional regulator with XRE-family HTH domain